MEPIDINTLSEQEKKNWENTIKSIIVSSKEFATYNSARQSYRKQFLKLKTQEENVLKAIKALQKLQNLNEKHWDKLIPGWRMFFQENPDELEQEIQENIESNELEK